MKNTAIGILTVLLFLMLFSGAVSAEWYSTNWTFRKNLTINKTLVINGSHSAFTILINITDSDLASYAQADGDDILFTNESGNKLNHEIELYNNTNGHLVAWVQIPNLSSTVTQNISMYFGNAGASNQQNVTGVWDSYYRAVWHLGEGDSTTSGYYKDSTSYGRNGTLTDADGDSAQGTGKLGNAMNFNGDADYIDAGADSLSLTNQITVEAWAYSDTDDDTRLVSKHGATYGWMLARAVDVDSAEWRTSTTGSDWDGGNAASDSFEVSTWTHIVGTYDGSNMRAFINGVESGGSFPYPQTGNVYNSPGSVQIARDGYSGDIRVFDGVLDEVRISNTNRSVDWINTEFNSMNDTAAFISVGPLDIGPVWYNTWPYRKIITLNSLLINGSHLDFPLLVNIPKNYDLSRHAQADGDDLVFTDATGDKLDHEIELYNSTTGQLVAWVRMANITNEINQVIYLYFGNSTTSSQQNKTGVWVSNYSGVWHFPNGGSLTANDSTSYGNNCTVGSGATAAAGIADGAASFDGTANGYINKTSPAGIPTGTSNRTYSAWVKGWTTPTSIRSIIYTGADSSGQLFTLGVGYAQNKSFFWGSSVNMQGGVNLTTAVWNYLVVTYNGTHMWGYVNGVYDTQGDLTLNTAASTVWIGKDPVPTYQNFNGIIDEPRISSTERSAEWIRTEFNNMNNSAFLDVEQTEFPINITSPTNTTYYNTTVNITFTVNTTFIGNSVTNCKIELDGRNMSVPLCSNITLSYVHETDWRLNASFDFSEQTGTVVYDRSTNHMNGTFVGSPIWNASGKIGGGITFSGVDYNYISVPKNMINVTGGYPTSTGDPQFTVAMWIYPHATGKAYGYGLLSHSDGANDPNIKFDLNVGQNGRLQVYIGDGSSWVIGTWDYIIETGKWQHIAMVFSGEFVSFYLDGEPVGWEWTSDTAHFLKDNSTNPWQLGCKWGGTNCFNGTIDEFAIWNRTLSSQEIRQLYYEQSITGAKNLKIWANDSLNNWSSFSVGFTITDPTPGISIASPTATRYATSDVPFSYTESDTSRDECFIEVNGVNYTYPYCTNTTFSYVKAYDPSKVLALDFEEQTGVFSYGRSNTGINATFGYDQWHKCYDYECPGVYCPIWNASGRFGGGITLHSNGPVIYFSRSGNYQDHAALQALSVGKPNMTVLTWIYPVYCSSSYGCGILDKSEGGGPDSNVRFTYNWRPGAEQLILVYGDGATANTAYGGAWAVPKNQWSFIALTINNNSEVKFYVNGTQSNSTQSMSYGIASSTKTFIIGYSYHSGLEWNVTFDEYAIYNRTMSADEIKQIYNNQALNGTYRMKIYVVDLNNNVNVSSVNFSIGPPDPYVNFTSPTQTVYSNSSINITYTLSTVNSSVSGCWFELNGYNMSYPLCSNTTLTYVHFNDSSKMVAYDFSEQSGNKTYDKSIYGRNGTIYEEWQYVGCSPPCNLWNSSGKYDGAITLRGSNDSILVPYGDWINWSTEPHTFAMWVKSNKPADYEHVLGQESAGTNQRLYIAKWTGQWGIGIQADGIDSDPGNFNVSTNWTFLVLTMNGTVATLYVDAVAGTSPENKKTYTSYKTVSYFLLGSYQGYSYNFNGTIDDFAIWNRTLTAAEVSMLYNEQYFNGTHTMKIWANNSFMNYSTVKVGIPTCNINEVINNTPWNLNCGDSCTVTGANTNVSSWSVYSTRSGIINIADSNISYANKTFLSFSDACSVVLGKNTKFIGKGA